MFLNIPARLAALGILFLLVSACEPDPFLETRPDRLNEIPDDAGLLAVHVINNLVELHSRLDTWTEVYVVDMNDTSKQYRLRPSGKGLINSRVFIGALPPGDYRIFNLRSYARHSDAEYWINAPLDGGLGTFRVEQGHFTSLGTVVYQPLGETEVDGRMQRLYTVVRVHEQENLESFVIEAFPRMFDDTAGKLILGWNPDEFPDTRTETAERVRAFAVGTETFQTSSGEVIMTGTLGHVFRRRGDADWERIDTGFSHQLLAFTPYDGGYLVAGERGLVLRADSLDGPWEVLPSPGTQEAFYWIAALDNGRFMVLARADDAVTAYLVDPDFRHWKIVAHFVHQPGSFSGSSREVVAVLADNGNVILFAIRRRMELDGDGEIVSSRLGRNFRDVRVQSDGTIVGIPNTGQPRFSRDEGLSWTSLPRSAQGESLRIRDPSPPFMLPNDEAWRFSHRWRVTLESRQVQTDRPLRLRRSTMEGEIFDWGRPVDRGCDRLRPDISSVDRFFAMCADGRLMMTTDQGQTWEVDFQPGGQGEDDSMFREMPRV